MTDLRAFLRRHIEAFLDHEFGPEGQNMTPSGIRRILWTSDHTNRLVHHLAGNWEMVEEAQRHLGHPRVEEVCDICHGEVGHRINCPQGIAFSRHAPPIKRRGSLAEVAADNAQGDAAAAEWDRRAAAILNGEEPDD